MKYLKDYKIFESNSEIESICEKYFIKNYKIRPDGTVDVDGKVDLSLCRLTKLPLKFGKVSSYFDCSSNRLTSLEGGPQEVGGDFVCDYNQLKSLYGSPKYVGGNFSCDGNKLKSLEGCPKEVGVDFYCRNNKLTIIKDEIQFMNISEDFLIEDNPIYEVYKLFPDFKSFQNSLDYNYFREPNLIVKLRFKEACQEAGIRVKRVIKGYQYI